VGRSVIDSEHLHLKYIRLSSDLPGAPHLPVVLCPHKPLICASTPQADHPSTVTGKIILIYGGGCVNQGSGS
jgi:hypothetical protein